MNRDANHPWSLWSAASLGPYITTTVTSSPAPGVQGQYNPAGVTWTNDPWASGNTRVISGDLQTNPENARGEWNQGEAYVRGDSAVFMLNGQVRTAGWNFQLRQNPGSSAPRIACINGNIGLQSEGAVLFYRNFEIQELDSITGLPLHATSIVSRRIRAQQRATGSLLLHTGTAWLQIPPGFSGADLHNLRGQRVWSYRGGEASGSVTLE